MTSQCIRLMYSRAEEILDLVIALGNLLVLLFPLNILFQFGQSTIRFQITEHWYKKIIHLCWCICHCNCVGNCNIMAEHEHIHF